VGGAFFFWLHLHSSRAGAHEVAVQAVNAPAKTAAPKPPAPLVITSQSPADFPRPVHDILEAQIALARRAISPGSIDSALGSQTRAAISVFQDTEDLPVTGELDDTTRAKLTLDAPILTTYTVTTNDLASLQPLCTTWLAKSQQTALAYETELELVAEKAHSHPLLIERLNPNVDWANVPAGTVLQIPDVNYPAPDDKAAFVVIHLADRYLEAFDQDTNLMLHFPCSIARKVEKRPVGELHVVVVIQNPNYTVDPELFPESDELQKIGHKVILPPGPKNPVGVAWMGLDKPGYGMHGTPNAQEVGRTESHGCFRLANWDAEYLSQLVWVGMPVEVQP
jgi:lipoprotein-anchoring transpeptidase ErfK/SrfK